MSKSKRVKVTSLRELGKMMDLQPDGPRKK